MNTNGRIPVPVIPTGPRRKIVLAGAGLAVAMGGFILGRFTAAPPPALPSLLPATVASVAAAPVPPYDSDSRAENESDWERRWQKLAAEPSSTANENSRALLLRDLAVRDPETALRIAQAEPTWRRRGILIRGALRGWAAVAPEAAVRWVQDHLRVGERRAAIEETIAGAINQPKEAVRVIAALCREDPLLASDHATALIAALNNAGDFEAGAEFAAAAPPEYRAHTLSTAFYAWAQHNPTQALAAANRFPDAVDRDRALQSLVSGWAMSDPATLLDYASNLPAGEIRAAALHEGLQQSVTHDPLAAAKWMSQFAGESSELDSGAAAVASIGGLVAQNPNVAIAWARSITDPAKRSEILTELVREWAMRDAPAARQFIEQSKDFQPGDRTSLLADLSGSSSTSP